MHFENPATNAQYYVRALSSKAFDDKVSVPSRVFFERNLAILSYSDLSWRSRQCEVLQDMYRLSMHPTKLEWSHALRGAAKSGNVQNAAWLIRNANVLLGLESNDTTTLSPQFWLPLFGSHFE
jgi:hypothetical protein